jgi:hypothetical protein
MVSQQGMAKNNQPVEQLQARITHWFEAQENIFCFEVDQYHCELHPQEDGVYCQINTGLTIRDIAPALLLQMTRAGLSRFSGLPAVNPANEYVLGVYLTLSGSTAQKKGKMMALIEDLLNQADVWCDIAISPASRHARHSAPISGLHAGLTLSQQLRTFQD